VHEVGEHAECGDQRNDLGEAPKGEEDTEQHVGGVVLILCLSFALFVLIMRRRGLEELV